MACSLSRSWSSATTCCSILSLFLVMPWRQLRTSWRTKPKLRITVVCFFTYSLGVIVLLTALYVILKPINPGLALAGALFRFVFALLWLLAPLNLLGALRLLSNANYLQVFEPDRLQALARLHLGANFDDYYVGLPFFGLAATVCAWLWLKSNYIPKGLAIFGVISSAWCVLCAFVFLIFPNFNKIVNDYIFDTPMAICSNSW